MKQLLFIATLILTLFANGQDVIITNEGDTIDCKITRVSEDFIHFAVYDKSGSLLLRSRLPMSSVSSYHQSIISTDSQSILGEADENVPVQYDSDPPSNFRLSILAGFTYQFGGYKWAPKSYQEQVQTLWNIGGDLLFFPKENWGVGVKYNHAYTGAEEDFDDGVGGVVELRDERIRFNYMAFSLFFRNFLSDHEAVYYTISGGLLKYRTDLMLGGQPRYEEGTTFSAAFGVVYDIIISDNLGMGIGLEINIAQLSELTINGASFPADFDLTRVDLVAGLRLFR